MQKIASAAFYYALFVQQPNFAFLWVFVSMDDRVGNTVSNKNLAGILFIAFSKNEYKKDVKQRVFQSYIVNRTVAVAAAVIIGLSGALSVSHLLVYLRRHRDSTTRN